MQCRPSERTGPAPAPAAHQQALPFPTAQHGVSASFVPCFPARRAHCRGPELPSPTQLPGNVRVTPTGTNKEAQSQVKNSNAAHVGLRAELFLLVFHTFSRTPNPPGRAQQFAVCFKMGNVSEGITICPVRHQEQLSWVIRAFPEDHSALTCEGEQPPRHRSSLLGKMNPQHAAGAPALLCRSPCPAFTSCYSTGISLSPFFPHQK